MNWKYVKPLESTENIDRFECLVKYAFPDDFRRCVQEHNGGRPERRVFDTNKARERVMKSFLSFNRGDLETVWDIREWNREELGERYIAFAIDNFGNLIAFDADTDHIVFINHEDMTVEQIADSFVKFMAKLRS
jgi:hypothetical protein